MIWQLMKLDVAWRFVMRQTVLFAVVAGVWHLFEQHFFLRMDDGYETTVTLLVMVFAPLFSVGVTPMVQPLDAGFQATLPVTMREIFMVRAVSTLALQWLPALAASMVLVLLGGQPASGTAVQAWWVFTCIVFCGQCAGIRGLRVRGVLRLIAVPVVLFVMNLIAFALDWPLRDSVPWKLALMGCWLYTGGVVARTWQTIPKSFELVPKGDSSGDTATPQADPALTRRAPWKPVLGTLFPLWGLEHLVIFGVMCVLHSPIIVIGVSGQGWTSMRTLGRWMLPLPIHRYALLVCAVLPGVLSLTCGYLAGVHLHIPRFAILRADKDLRSQLVAVVMIAGWSLVANLLALAGDWHIVRRILPPWNWPAIFASPILGLALMLGIFHTLGSFEPVRWLSNILPANLTGAAAVSLALLAGLWMALHAMFRRVEFADKPARGAV